MIQEVLLLVIWSQFIMVDLNKGGCKRRRGRYLIGMEYLTFCIRSTPIPGTHKRSDHGNVVVRITDHVSFPSYLFIYILNNLFIYIFTFLCLYSEFLRSLISSIGVWSDTET